jgi:hypothetical protein
MPHGGNLSERLNGLPGPLARSRTRSTPTLPCNMVPCSLRTVWSLVSTVLWHLMRFGAELVNS